MERNGTQWNAMERNGSPLWQRRPAVYPSRVADFEEVVALLDAAVGQRPVGTHGAFWRSMTRDEFVAGEVVGERLLIVGDGAGSNLVKALRGLIPFGTDTGTPGAAYRRMPAGRRAMRDADIDKIEAWIDAGCPAGASSSPRQVRPTPRPSATASTLPRAVPVDTRTQSRASLDEHVAFWRELDDWALFNQTDLVRGALQPILGAGRRWIGAVAAGRDPTPSYAGLEGEVELLAQAQTVTLVRHFGNPLELRTMMDSFEKFGADEFPRDPLRPDDPVHNMNAPVMWFHWAGFCEACIHRRHHSDFWYAVLRAVFVGAACDAIVRRRFDIWGGMSRQEARRAALSLSDAELISTMRVVVERSGIA